VSQSKLRPIFRLLMESGARRKQSPMMKVITATAALLIAAAAHAEPLLVPKPSDPGGSCPHGYLASGSYCVPGQGAQEAIAKPPNGTCPWGWIASGSYCLRNGARLAR
jgi:hypothetical protein